MDRRYLAALLFTALVLIGYPYYLRWIGVTPKQGNPTQLSTESSSVLPETQRGEPATLTRAEKIPYQNKLYEVLFTTRGGSILSLKQEDALLYEAGPEEKGIFGITLQDEGEDLEKAIFEDVPSPPAGAARQFVYEKPGNYRVQKRFFVAEEKPALILEVDLENLSDREKSFSLGFHYGLGLGLHHTQRDDVMAKMVIFSGDELRSTDLRKIQKHGYPTAGPFEWHGLLRKYYALLVKPEVKGMSQETRFEEGRFVSDLRLAPVSVAAGGKKTVRFLIYAGPQAYKTLEGFGAGFEKILTQGMLGVLRTALLVSLNFCYRLTRNYGAAILLITLFIKLLFTPLTHLSYESMRKMQALQPKLKAIQKQHQKDPGRLNKEMMELYKRNRVNPMMGCLPLVLQIPIFISFYQVLAGAVELKHASFLWWIHDLSEPDRLFTWPTDLPFVGTSFNLLPVLMIGSMLWQQKLTPQTAAAPGQEKIMYFMPVIFGFVFYNLPSGLVLYWLVNNLLTIFHQLVIKRIPVILHHEDQHQG